MEAGNGGRCPEAPLELLSVAGELYRSESGVEVKLKEVRWSLIPDLVRDLERRFELVSLSAVDNTGKGVFELRFVVR